MKPNPFEVLLDELTHDCAQPDTKLVDVVDRMFGRVVNSVFDRPDALGVSVVQSFSINNKAALVADPERAFLIVLRGELRSGDRVVSFTGGASPLFAIGQLLLDAATGQLQWRADDQTRTERQTLADLVAGKGK